MQNALSIVTRINPDQVTPLENLLETIGHDLRGNSLVPFPEFTTLHFACWVVLKRNPDFAPCLVLESNFDGTVEAHLDEFLHRAASGLNAIYRHCEDYPVEAAANPALLKNYLLAHSIESPAFYIGCYEQSLNSVRNALATRQQIECFLDREQAKRTLADLAPIQIYDRIKAALKQQPPDPCYTPETPYSSRVFRAKAVFAVWIALAVLLLPLLLVFLLFYVPLLRAHEREDDATPGPPFLPVDPRLFDKEDIYTQNHLTTLTNIKPGKFRLRTLKGILWIINKLAQTVFTTGNLGGIPTIHFARWLLIDDDRRLLFFSNYDGSWASYLGDFVDKANYGLTSVWSNTVNFPPTHYLFFGGAQHIEAFKAWSRQSNEYAAVWYSAYPDATVRNITQAVEIRDTLYGTPTDPEIREWLKKL